MDRDAIRELFDYTGWAWERIARLIDEHSQSYATSAPGSGWPTVAACLSHVLATYDGWLNGPWAGVGIGEMSYPAEWPKPIEAWPALQAYRERVRASFLVALDRPDDLLYGPRYREEGSPGGLLSLADILTNLVLHERGHHGDLNTLFAQHGVTGYFLDYAFYRSQPGAFVLDDGTN